MQIIAGSLRARRIKTLGGDLTRPTSALVRGAMFNILGPRLAGARVLDLYAGSGAIAIEALSRGAASAVLVERASDAQKVIAENLRSLEVSDRATLVRGDVMTRLATLEGPFDLVIADPPYRSVDWGQLLERLAASGLVAPDGAILFEHATGESLPQDRGPWVLERTYKYGTTMLSLYRPGQPR